VSTTIETARADIESAVSLAWTSRTSIQYADRPFDIPASGTWMRVTPLWGDGFPMTMGGAGVGKNRIVGVLDATLFAPKGSGLGAIEVLADDVRLAFNQQKLGIVQFREATGPKEIDTDKAYAQLQVSIPFEVEETV
jgi:hypothetical protein